MSIGLSKDTKQSMVLIVNNGYLQGSQISDNRTSCEGWAKCNEDNMCGEVPDKLKIRVINTMLVTNYSTQTKFNLSCISYLP